MVVRLLILSLMLKELIYFIILRNEALEANRNSIDGVPVSAPNVDEPILGGSAIISGSFNPRG